MVEHRRVGGFTQQEHVVLFTDLHEFSKIMKADPSGSIDLIQAYYDNLGEDIVFGGGRIVKYLGDAILALFPKGNEIAAVEAALKMRSAYARLLKEHSVSVTSEVEIGIGAGDVVSGIFGHESLRCFDIFGDTVNEVAMIMHHRGIAVTAAVRNRVSSRFPTRRLQDVRVKWKADLLEVWEIIEDPVD